MSWVIDQGERIFACSQALREKDLFMCSYAKGKRFGFAVYRDQVKNYGELGVLKAEKGCSTCEKYASTGKKNGKHLTKDQRSFYRGAVMGFREYRRKKLK